MDHRFILINKEWLDRYVQAYSSLNILGFQIEERQKEGLPPTDMQILIYQKAINELYRLLEITGRASIDDPEVKDVI